MVQLRARSARKKRNMQTFFPYYFFLLMRGSRNLLETALMELDVKADIFHQVSKKDKQARKDYKRYSRLSQNISMDYQKYLRECQKIKDAQRTLRDKQKALQKEQMSLEFLLAENKKRLNKLKQLETVEDSDLVENLWLQYMEAKDILDQHVSLEKEIEEDSFIVPDEKEDLSSDCIVPDDYVYFK